MKGVLLATALLLAALCAPLALGPYGLVPVLDSISLGPSLHHPFGTDGLGRDILARALHGLGRSLAIAGAASLIAGAIALTLALWSSCSPRADRLLRFGIDAMLALPHLMLLILLAFVTGGGAFGLCLALALSHWPRLARLLRAEARALAARPYVEAARAFGHGPWRIAAGHILPQLWPQWLVGITLMLPHAVLHEAGLTFIGFGFDPSSPALGVMLAEAMRHIASGRWWLVLGPGLVLLAAVLVIEAAGRALHRLAGALR